MSHLPQPFALCLECGTLRPPEQVDADATVPQYKLTLARARWPSAFAGSIPVRKLGICKDGWCLVRIMEGELAAVHSAQPA